MKSKNQHTLDYRLIVKSAVLTIAVCISARMIQFAVTNPAIRETVVLATTVKPETLTELYFEDHTNLPKQIELGKVQTFKFTVHNLEYQNMTYAYEVGVADDETSRALASGSATLSHNQFKTIPVSYTLSSASGRTKIQVTLQGRNQSIGYWMENL
jgi:hypothetical protein